MTKAEAEALQVKWKERRLSLPGPGEVSACTHSNQELEWREDGYLTGKYCCLHCGELVGKKL
jgi:hypothetical protein